MNGRVFRAAFGGAARPLLFVTLGAAAFFYLVLVSFPSFIGQGGGGFAEFFQEPPRFIEAFLGGSANFFEPSGWIVVGMTHPVILALQTAGALMVASGAVATELERGTLELVLSRPVGRMSFLAAKMAASLATVTIVQIGGVIGTLIARWTIPEVSSVPVGDILAAFLGSWVLFGAFAMVGVLISAGSSLRGRATGAAVGVVVAGFFANFMATLIDEVDWLRYVSPFHYFRAGDLMRGEGLLDLLVLVVLGAVAAAVGIRRFATRDLTR